MHRRNIFFFLLQLRKGEGRLSQVIICQGKTNQAGS